MLKRGLLLTLLGMALAGGVSAQVIPIRTVPVSQSHQFDIYPSLTRAMGGVSIAVDDSLLDPFGNPAMAARIRVGRVFSTPGVYSVSSGAGAGRTLPMGVLTRAGSWFGGVSLALQEVDLSERARFPIAPFDCPTCRSAGVEFGQSELSHGNTHVFAMLGRDLPAAGLSIGGSFQWSGLSAVDGVDLLYANSARVLQAGDALDVRLGVLKEWDGDRSLQAVAVHSRFGMTHDVVYLDQFWDPGPQQFSQRPRVEQNQDRTRLWGAHFEYERPLSADGWRVGWLATVNRVSHPKIPNYEIMNIPRDPGHSSAFNVGIGISRTRETSTFGADLVFEPIWSHTWADSEEPVETAAGAVIAPGGMTIENHFVFSNALFRMGFDQELYLGDGASVAALQFGLAVRSIDYRLEQQNHVQLTQRAQEEQWVEWMPTWGFRLGFTELQIRYRGSITSGTGRPGVFGGGGGLVVADAAPASNILVAPSGPLSLTEVQVMTHQFSISLPIR